MWSNDAVGAAADWLAPEWTEVSEPFPVRKAPGRPLDRLTRMALFGVAFDAVTSTGAIDTIEQFVDSREPHYVVTPNVDFLVRAQADPELRRILLRAHLVLCDGMPLVWLSRATSQPVPERVAGADLTPRLLQHAARHKYRVYFLGGQPESITHAVQNVRLQFPGVNIVGYDSPPFRPLLELNHQEIIARIRNARPDLLFVAFGCPKAEKWMSMHYLTLGVPVCIGIGGTIDFLAGRIRRAPRWVQRTGAEWIYRLAQEPRRLWRRYASDISGLSRLLLRQTLLAPRSLARAKDTPTEIVLVEPTWSRVRTGARLDRLSVLRDSRIWEQANGRHVLLDLDQVQRIDSSGVGLLLAIERRLRESGHRLLLLAPSPPVRRLLCGLGLQRHFVSVSDTLAARELLDRYQLEDASPVIVEHVRGQQKLIWRGEIHARNAETVWRLTKPWIILQSPRSELLHIDLSAVRLLDSAGMIVMLRASKYAAQLGSRLCFPQAPADLLDELRAGGLDQLLPNGLS